jgi:hypothetical protein
VSYLHMISDKSLQMQPIMIRLRFSRSMVITVKPAKLDNSTQVSEILSVASSLRLWARTPPAVVWISLKIALHVDRTPAAGIHSILRKSALRVLEAPATKMVGPGFESLAK